MSPDRIRPGSARRRDQAEQSSDEDDLEVAGGAEQILEDEQRAEQEQLPVEDEVEEAVESGEVGELTEDERQNTDEFFDEGDEDEQDDESAAARQPTEAALAREQRRAARRARPHGRLLRIYYGETRYDFVRRKRLWFTISAVVLLAGIISLSVRGLNLGIEFVGGTSWTVQTTTLTVDQASTAVSKAGVSGATITTLGHGDTRTVEVQAKLPSGQSAQAAQNEADNVAQALATASHTNVQDVSIETVGPTWGGQITHKAIIALIVFFVMIALYISIFFEWRMALAAIVAVLHDIVVTVGIYSLTGLLVTPDTVVVFLTILGYSLYDTIVVFDRVRDNLRHLSIRDRMTLTDIVNLSMNQTLARSINTSLVAIMPILAVLILGAQILGATTLQYFGLALLVGLTTGAYSSIFIASPLVAILKEREQRFRIVRERLESRGTDVWLISPAELAAGQFAEASATNPRFSARARARQDRLAQATPSSNGEPTDGSLTDAPSATRSAAAAGTGPRPSQGRPRKPAARSKRRGGGR